MRDITRDAAIITVAQTVMNDPHVHISPDAFIETYSAEGKAREELIGTLSLFNLMWTQFQKTPWDMEGHHVKLWSNESGQAQRSI
jgi:hypothetical protein